MWNPVSPAPSAAPLFNKELQPNRELTLLPKGADIPNKEVNDNFKHNKKSIPIILQKNVITYYLSLGIQIESLGWLGDDLEKQNLQFANCT